MVKFRLFGGGIEVRRNKIEKVSLDDTQIHCHDKYEILYVIEGSGKCIIEGEEYTLRPRCVFVFLPFAYHSLSLELNTAFEYVSITFEQKNAVPSVQDILLRFKTSDEGLTPAVFYGADSVSDQIAAIIDRFEAIVDFSEDHRNKFTELLLSELILLLSMPGRVRSDYNENELGARVIKYLNENERKDISLDELAKRFFVSKYYLCRAFKKHNGISIHGYINRKRVMYAKQLIENGETASRAAYLVGFGDYSAFYRAYVKIVGKSPTEF